MLTVPPKIEGATGLVWRRKGKGWAAIWIATASYVRQGYQPKTRRVWFGTDLTEADLAAIKTRCEGLRNDLLDWKRRHEGLSVDRPSAFDGTVRGLSMAYQADPDSGFCKIRYTSRCHYQLQLAAIERSVGARRLDAVKGRDFRRWFDEWATDPDGSIHIPRAAESMKFVRLLIRYGASVLEDEACQRLASSLDNQQFYSVKAREKVRTEAQVVALRKRAHEAGRPEIALAEAFLWDLMLRPSDVYGQWVPESEPGLSEVTSNGNKWLYGLRWNEIADLRLTHRISKSIKGRAAVMDPDAGKTKTWNLRNCPMVMEELVDIDLSNKGGPIIVNPETKLPFRSTRLKKVWRELARDVGIPDHIQLRDSRAGAITHGIRATGGNVSAVRHAAGHSKTATTEIYNRMADEQTDEVARARAKKEQA